MIKAFIVAIIINMFLLFLYVKYVMPYINEAALNMARIMVGQ